MEKVHGPIVDEQTRCKHYHTKEDIIAIKFRCCQKYYPCYRCHQECEDHSPLIWEKSAFNERAILCGVCGTELTINEYVHTSHCLQCGSKFNSGCKTHHHLYFE